MVVDPVLIPRFGYAPAATVVSKGLIGPKSPTTLMLTGPFRAKAVIQRAAGDVPIPVIPEAAGGRGRCQRPPRGTKV